MEWRGSRDAPMCPTMLKPVGMSEESATGSMALIMSSRVVRERCCSIRYLSLARTYGSSSSRSLIRDYTVRD